MSNLTSVGVTNGVPNSGTGTVSTLDNLIGTAGTPSAQVQSVQGVAGGTAVPVSAASLPLPTGAALESGGNLAATAAVAGTTSGAAVVTDANGTLQQYLRGLVKIFAAAIVGGAGSLFSKITDGTNTAAVKAASTAPVATDPALVVAISPNSVNANVQNGAPVTIVAATPTATANGATSSRVKAAATTNATSLKASAGQIYSIDVFNNAAYTVYLKLYNKASAPTVGTDTPSWTMPIASGGGFSREFPRGKTFTTGIAYAITKLEVDTDTTVVAVDDLTGSIDWI